MTFALTGYKPANGSIRATELVCFDTEAESRAEAENWLQKGYQEVAVWKQIGVPKLETKVSWDRGNEECHKN